VSLLILDRRKYFQQFPPYSHWNIFLHLRWNDGTHVLLLGIASTNIMLEGWLRLMSCDSHDIKMKLSSSKSVMLSKHVTPAHKAKEFMRLTAYFICFFVFAASELSISSDLSSSVTKTKGLLQAPAILTSRICKLNHIYWVSNIGLKLKLRSPYEKHFDGCDLSKTQRVQWNKYR
jgi:hypothetical protein